MNTIPAINRYFTKLVEAKSHKLLTPAVNELYSLVRAYNECIDGIDAFHAPSECYRDVYDSTKHRAELIAKKHGFINLDVLVSVIEKRTTCRWVYFSGLGYFSGNS